jgi:hypothetical protein
MNGSTTLSEEFLHALVDDLAGKQTVAIILAGSHAQGDATPYSDVDMAHLVAAPLSGPDKQYYFREGHLVSVATRPLAWFRAAVTRPEHAVLCLAGLRQARILLDREGTFRAFQQELENFSWVPLQEAANSYASSAMMHLAELAHKVLSALVRGDRLSLFEATSSLWFALTQAVAVQRGVLAVSSHTHMRQVREAVGTDAPWTRYHGLVAESDVQAAHATSVETRAIAALCLYQETVVLLRSVIRPEHREVAEQTVVTIEAALPQLRSISDRLEP